MRTFALIAGAFCIVIVLTDAFQTIILPRRATGPVRLTRIFYILTWRPWRFIAERVQHSRKRETAFSFYGPLSLILLLAVWAAGLLLGFTLLYYSLGSPFHDVNRQQANLWSDMYISGTTVFTLGLGDVVPRSSVVRVLIVIESGIGFGFLAVVMGYFPVLYGAFSRREVSISLLDARAGSPPTSAELLRRHATEEAQALSNLLIEWERWSAELLESHISFPLLCYFRSQHTNQSWLGALTSILDTSSLLIAGVRGHEARQAQLTFAMARHAVVDLTQVLTVKIVADAPDRLPHDRYERLYGMLCQSGVSMCRDDRSEERLRELRKLYEPYVETLGRYFAMPLPPWIPDQPRKDNWLTVARVRENAEAANVAPLIASEGHAHTVDPFHDEHHEF
jgi:hypothetical protein